MKISLITDAWYPQVNGVVRTLDMTLTHLRAQGCLVDVISPRDFKTFPCPTYPEIRLSLTPGARVAERIGTFQPDAIHIATEGPLGIAARRFCIRQGLSFTTAYHTKFPDYINLRTKVPLSWLYKVMRWFHGPSSAVMVATDSITQELNRWGITNTKRWPRGVDLKLFRPYGKDGIPALNALPRPISIYVGRVAVEKNIQAFLDVKTPGSKVVVGDGPQLESLKKAYPHVAFVGEKTGEELAKHYAAADVFVFPSLTDTFGLVNLEALACGVPVAAYPVPGPLDIIGKDGKGTVDGFKQPIGALDEDLSAAVQKALKADPQNCRRYAAFSSWDACTSLFLHNLVKADSGKALIDAQKDGQWVSPFPHAL